MKKKYMISKAEINRRIVAYTTLIISLFGGLVIFSFDYIRLYPDVSLYIIVILAGLLFCSRIMVIKYFDSILKGSVDLNSEYIRKNEVKYVIKSIKKVLIKRTTKGHIREIKIIFNNRKTTYINNSLIDLENFVKELEGYLPKNAIIKTIYEPIDFDHPAFYLFSGLIISFVSIEFLKFIFTLSVEKLKIIYYVLSFSSAILGIYFITYKPICKRDEKANQITDYIWGGIFMVGAVLVLLSIIFKL